MIIDLLDPVAYVIEEEVKFLSSPSFGIIERMTVFLKIG